MLKTISFLNPISLNSLTVLAPYSMNGIIHNKLVAAASVLG